MSVATSPSPAVAAPAAAAVRWPETRYSIALLVMTAATGAVDAVSYLALDRVFTGNMTGNVLFIAFGVIGIDDIPVLNNLVALLTFMLGAVVGSRIIRRTAETIHLPLRSIVCLIGTTAGAGVLATVWLFVGELTEPMFIVITGILAFLLGAQAASVKPIGIRDLSTVVVTMTMVNLSTDSRLAGGKGKDWLRRISAILAMGLGALLAALLCTRVGGPIALLAATGLMAVGVVLLALARRRELALL